jgi:hypothetical protein
MLPPSTSMLHSKNVFDGTAVVRLKFRAPWMFSGIILEIEASLHVYMGTSITPVQILMTWNCKKTGII